MHTTEAAPNVSPLQHFEVEMGLKSTDAEIQQHAVNNSFRDEIISKFLIISLLAAVQKIMSA